MTMPIATNHQNKQPKLPRSMERPIEPLARQDAGEVLRQARALRTRKRAGWLALLRDMKRVAEAEGFDFTQLIADL